MDQVFFDSDGRQLHLKDKIGAGGEGSLFEIAGQSNYIAKMYDIAPDAELQQKLQFMISVSNPKLRQFCAWPLRLIHSGSQSGPLAGFLMNYFRNAVLLKDIQNHYDRVFHFPHFNWKDLVHLAEQLAKAVSIVHSSGIVVGDLHAENIMVSQSAIPFMIDCDSWQLRHPQRIFRCKVLRDDFTPPELQSVDFSRIQFTENHDAFGLAFIIFSCLFPGQNPFAGRYTGAGLQELPAAIKEYRYAYAKDGRRRKISPPFGSLLPAKLTPPLVDLFERAFTRRRKRPTAQQWHAAIQDFRKGLVPCSANRLHFYHKSLAKCPLCEFETENLKSTYPDATPQKIVDSNLKWVISPTWQQISQIAGTNITFPIPGRPGIVGPLSSQTEKWISAEVLSIQFFTAGFIFNLVCVILGLFPRSFFAYSVQLLPATLIFIVLFPAHWQIVKLIVLSYMRFWKAYRTERALRRLPKTARAMYQELTQFNVIRESLEKSLLEYQNLRAFHQANFAAIAEKRFLESHSVSETNLPKLSISDVSNAHRNRIRTAADVQTDRIHRTTSLPETVREELLQWRYMLGKSFTQPPYDPSLDPAFFQTEFSLYQLRIPREQFLNGLIPRIQSHAAKLTKAEAEIAVLRTQAFSDSAAARSIFKKLLEPLVNPSPAARALLLLAILSPPAYKLAVNHIQNHRSVHIAAKNTSPPKNHQIDRSVPERVPSPLPHASMKPIVPDRPSTKTPVKSSVPAVPGTVSRSVSKKQSPVRQTGHSSSDSPSHTHDPKTGPSSPTKPPSVLNPIARFMKAYAYYKQNRHNDGLMELEQAILQSGGKTPAAVFERLEREQGDTRRAFEKDRVNIERRLKKKVGNERNAEHGPNGR